MSLNNASATRAINEATVLEAARAVAGILPSAQPLTVGTPAPGSVDGAAVSAGAAVAQLDGLAGGAIGVLVGPELVSALASSPLGELDLAAAVQPALDATAAALGTTAKSGSTLEPSLVEQELGSPFTAVPLLAGEAVHAILLVTTRTVETAAPPAPNGTLPHNGSAPQTVADMMGGRRPGIELLHGVVMEVTVELGRTRMPVRDLLELTPGTVLELDRAAGSPADLLVNGRLIARGEVVVVDEDFGLRVTEIITNAEAGKG